MSAGWMFNGLTKPEDEGSPDWLDDEGEPDWVNEESDSDSEGEPDWVEEDSEPTGVSSVEEPSQDRVSSDDEDGDDFSFGDIVLTSSTELGVGAPDVDDVDGGSTIGAGMSPIAASNSGGSEDDPRDMLSYEDRAKIHSDNLIATVLQEGTASAELRRWLYANAMPEVFSDENYLIYNTMYRFRAENFAMNTEFLDTYLNINLGEVEKSGSFIDLNKYSEIDGSYARGYVAGTVKHFEGLSEKKPLNEEEFHRAFENYLLYYQQIEGTKVYEEASTILQDGLKTAGTKGLKAGFEDSANYVRRGIAEIEGKLNRNEGTGFVTLREAIMNTEDSRVEVSKVADFGEINELNSHFGGLFSGMLVTIVGPPKAGKSKFSARIIYDAVTSMGQNVTYWPVEGGVKMLEAQFRAIHFHEFYNGPVLRGEKSREEGIWGVTQGAILKKTLGEISTKVDVESFEQASAIDMVTNPEYGSIDMIDRPFNVETFLDELEISITSNGSSVVCIDYMQLIQSERNLNTREALAEAYPKFLDFVKKHNVLAISPAQYTQSAVSELAKSGGKDMDMRTAIGESSAIMRSSDLVLAMYATPEDIRNHDVSFMSVPARLDQPFEQFSVYADLGTCTFSSYSEGDN